jgi:PST family polysaccharide transporter
MAKAKLIENAAALGLLQFVNLALPVVALPLLAHRLGQDQLGRMAFALSVAQIFVVLTDYGFSLSGPKTIALRRDDPAMITSIWAAITALRAAFTLAGILLLLILAAMFDRFARDLPLIMSAYAMVVGNILYPQWLFQGLERLKMVSAIQVGARLLAFAALFIFVKGPRDLYAATFLQASGFLLGGILSLPHTLGVLRQGKLTRPSRAELRTQLADGWHVFLSSAAVNIYTSSNAFFLGLLAPAAMVGQFHVAERVVRAIQSLYAPISNAIYPYAARLAAESPLKLIRFNGRLLAILGGGALVGSIVLFALAGWIVRLMFGDGYSISIMVLRIMAIIPLVVIVSNILGTQTLLPLGYHKTFSRILLAFALINFSIFIPLAYWFGAIGAAVANVMVEIGVTLSMAGAVYRGAGRPFLQTAMGKCRDDAGFGQSS